MALHGLCILPLFKENLRLWKQSNLKIFNESSRLPCYLLEIVVIVIFCPTSSIWMVLLYTCISWIHYSCWGIQIIKSSPHTIHVFEYLELHLEIKKKLVLPYLCKSSYHLLVQNHQCKHILLRHLYLNTLVHRDCLFHTWKLNSKWRRLVRYQIVPNRSAVYVNTIIFFIWYNTYS